MTEPTVDIAIVEDNEVVREGFTLLIDSMEGYKVVAGYGSCEEALKDIENRKPEIVLMDIELPGMNGLEGTQKIKQLLPSTNVIVITVHEESRTVFDALCAGAIGYITKNSNYDKLKEAIQEVHNGGAPMSGHIARMVVDSFQKNPESPLSPRETEVLELLARGKSYSVIADQLFVHKETIKSHIKNIYTKLQVNSKAEAIEKALKNKFI
jgi:DNA-binding NarL/FixJ family response regulator